MSGTWALAWTQVVALKIALREAELDQWLRTRHERFVESLRGQLDVEAGLQDLMRWIDEPAVREDPWTCCETHTTDCPDVACPARRPG